MKLLNLYTVLSIASAPASLFKKKEDRKGERLNVRQQVINETKKRFDYLTGRWDTIERVPTRQLFDVGQKDEAVVKAMGAIRDEKGVWTVPEGLSLKDFAPWGRPVPSDIVDRDPRMESTKDGKPIEGYKLIEDEHKGSDSTALPLMLGAMVIFAAFATLAMKVHPILAAPFLLLSIPYIITYAQSEKFGSTFAAVFITMVMPIALCNGAYASMSFNLNDLIGTLIQGGILVLGLSLALVGQTTGSWWHKLKHSAKWSTLIIGSIGTVVGVYFWFGRPEWMTYLMDPMWFILPIAYPMLYSNAEYVKRAEKLLIQGKYFNLATQGQLNNAHIKAREKQAEAAAKDLTPFIPMGTATGHMTQKKYPFAPDKGNKMGLTPLDLTMHYILFGATGKGKTASRMRPMAAACYKLSQEGFPIGVYIDCGKGALGGDLSGITDITVKTGVPFAYYQGLDPEGAEMALNTKTLKKARSEGKDQIWANGAKMLISHLLRIQWSLVEHEKEQKRLACEKVKHFYKLILMVDARIHQATDDEKATLEFQRQQLQSHYDQWLEVAENERQWLWNVDCTEKLRQYIDLPRRVNNEWVAGPKMSQILNYLGMEPLVEPLENGQKHPLTAAYEKRRQQEPRTIHPAIGRGSLLDDSIDYAMRVWPATDEAQRSSFMINAKDILFPLMRGSFLVDQNGTRWCYLEEGVQPELCLYGKITACALPEGTFGETGLMISALVKQRIYKGIRRRLDGMQEQEWRAEGQTPLLLLWDEVQSLVSEEDIKLLPQARSAWVMAYFATQGYDSLINAFGSEHAAELFCNTFQSVETLSTSQITYDYLSKRFGTALMTVFMDHTRGIDYEGSASKYLRSPFNDPNHPNWSVIQKVERLGGARFEVPIERIKSQNSGFFNPWQSKEERSPELEVALGFIANVGGQKEVQPLFKPEEFSALLQGHGVSIAYLQRAGAPRVDVMEFGYMGPDELRKTKQQLGEAS